MTNNIIEISASGLFGGLQGLFFQFIAPVVLIWAGLYGVKVIIRAFKRVSHG